MKWPQWPIEQHREHVDNMDFIQAIANNQEIILDEELKEMFDNLDLDALDEDALERIEKRVSQREIALYSYLVGKENALKAKIFVEKATNGSTVPSNIVNGYLPIVEMMQDIVKAGPGYINLLKSLHKRAKNTT